MREGHTHKKKFHSFDALYPTILFPCPDVMCWFDILSTPIVFFLRFFFLLLGHSSKIMSKVYIAGRLV